MIFSIAHIPKLSYYYYYIRPTHHLLPDTPPDNGALDSGLHLVWLTGSPEVIVLPVYSSIKIEPLHNTDNHS
jgi:hypothetical protein